MRRSTVHLILHRLSTAVALALMTACAKRPAGVVLPPVPAASIDTVDDSSVTHRFRYDSARYAVDVMIVSEEVSPGTARDSSRYQEFLLARLDPQTDTRAQLSIQADSGYRRIAIDSMTGTPPARMHTSPLVSISLALTLQGARQDPLPTSPSTTCPSAESFLTPLLAHVIGRASLPVHHRGTDTLTYTACVGEATTRSVYFIQSGAAISASRIPIMRIAGVVTTDSTRFLPMVLRGDINGRVYARAEHPDQSLPILDVELDADLQFTSSLRSQHIRQSTRIQLRRVSR